MTSSAPRSSLTTPCARRMRCVPCRRRPRAADLLNQLALVDLLTSYLRYQALFSRYLFKSDRDSYDEML